MKPDPLVIANCSGFYGDRMSAAREMVEGGPIDVLTGDWLAELTMLILRKDALRRPGGGFARTFLSQLEDVLATCIERGIRIVSNAGGLNPAGLAVEVQRLADRLGVNACVAWVDGDDVLDRVPGWSSAGRLRHAVTGEPVDVSQEVPLTANAYLGGTGIAAGLRRGADIVVTGRVTDASLVVGPGIWRFGWDAGDLDALAGAVVAGHVIECGCQASGGNFSFFEEVSGLEHCGFPLVELREDGSSVVTKHPGTGGAVTVETVTAQLLYEIAGAAYPNPDVVARLDTVELRSGGRDRVVIEGVRGEAAPAHLKVALNIHGGYRNHMLLAGTGPNARRKAELAARALWARVPGGKESFERTDVRFVPGPPADERAPWLLRATVLDRDEARVGRAFSSAVVENALSIGPGYFTATRPRGATEVGVYIPALVERSLTEQWVHIDDTCTEVSIDLPPPPTPAAAGRSDRIETRRPPEPGTTGEGAKVTMMLGRVAGSRSGDKGGDVNIGVWGRTAAAHVWLDAWLTGEQLAELLPDVAGFPIERCSLPNLRAVNFVVRGMLGRGVADNLSWDAQGKTICEQLRACEVEIPVDVVASFSNTG